MQDADVAKQAELTWPEFEKADKKVALLPVGVVEAHGPPGHGCPYGDVHRREGRRGGRRPSTAAYLVQLHLCPRQISRHHLHIAGTLYRLYKGVFLEAARNSVKHLVVVNGHGGNVDLLRTAAREVAKTTSLVDVLINWWVGMAKEARRRVLETPEGHAAED
jgi:creatinine amidohydrolase